MESGAIPPPKRAPRSLVGPPKAAAKPHYVSPPSSASTVTSSPNLGGGAQFDAPPLDSDERRRLTLALRDERRRLEGMMRQQVVLEEELVSKNATISSLTGELKLLKQRKHSVDSEYAQSTADFLNSQARWLRQVEDLTDEIQTLKAKLAQAQLSLDAQNKEARALHERETARLAEKRRQDERTSRPDASERNSDKLEIHQNRLLVAELKTLHGRLRQELAEQKSLNDRLTQTNQVYKDEIDQYQYLLIEKTVTGDLHPGPQALLGGEQLLGDEELLGGGELLSADLQASNTEFSAPNMATSASDPRSADTACSSDIASSSNMASSPDLAASSSDVAASTSPDGTESTSQNDSLETPATTPGSPGDGKRAKEPVSRSSPTTKESDDLNTKQVLKRQQFELASLQNHNRALKVSLERLVARLLENRSFSQIVEDSVSPHLVQTFRSRVSGTAPRDARPGADQAASKTAASMIFNQNYTGTPSRRVFSLGVDNEVKGPPPVALSPGLNPQHTGSTVVSSTVASTDDDFRPPSSRRFSSHGPGYRQRSVSPLTNILSSGPTTPSGGRKYATAYPNAASVESKIPPDFRQQKTVRVESLTGMRKLRLGD